MMIILGMQEYSMPIAKWLNKNTSVSWLRAFEQLKNVECHALLCTDEKSCEITQDNICYHFIQINQSANVWFENISKIKPNKILSNFFPSNLLDIVFEQVSENLPTTELIIRLHSEPKINFRYSEKSLMYADILILSMEHQIKEITDNYNYNSNMQFKVIPFGFDDTFFFNTDKPKIIDVITIADPSRNFKNYPLVEKVLQRLRLNNISSENIGGLNKNELLDKLSGAKVIYYPSLIEASGGRTFLESIAVGCYPIVDIKSITCCKIVETLNYGKITNSKSTMTLFKQTGFDENKIDFIIEQIKDCVKNYHKLKKRVSLDNFSERSEINKLIEILSS